MPDSITEEILKLDERFEGKENDLLQAIEEIQNRGNLSIKDELICEAAKARTHMSIGSFGIAMRTTRRLYKKGKINNLPLAMIDALSLKFLTKWLLG